MRTEVGWATNITGALVHRVSSKSPEIPPPQWNILQDALGEPAKVLIVEPDESNRSAIVNLLRGVGHEVTAVSNGHEAWDFLTRDQVDCVLSDVRMAAMAGRTLYEQVEEKMPHVARRFVFVTGDYARPESYQFLVESRQPVVGKPYEVETLIAAIATVLQQVGRHRASGEVELEQ
jgi:CheY-like chemotaxis protein